MSLNKWFLLSLVAIIAQVIVGCGTSPTATPAPTQPAQVVTVVITATLPPPTATPAQATLTPLPTVALTATVPSAVSPTTAAVAQSTKPPVTSKPAATKTPTKVAATATATALAMKFGAPVINKPIWTDNEKDEVKFYGGAIVFDWQSVGGLNGDECYLVQVRTEPVNGTGSQSDYWLTSCGDQTGAGVSVKFTLESPNRIGTAPNYSSIILLDANQMWAHWSVTVVKNLGSCDPSYQFHCKYAPLSPTSTNYFLFKGQ